jgi:hypothetical protein
LSILIEKKESIDPTGWRYSAMIWIGEPENLYLQKSFTSGLYGVSVVHGSVGMGDTTANWTIYKPADSDEGCL